MKKKILFILMISVSIIFQLSCQKKTDNISYELLDILTSEKYDYICMITNSDTNFNSYKNAVKIREYTKYLSSKHLSVSNDFKRTYNKLIDLYVSKTKAELCKVENNENNSTSQLKLIEYLVLSSIADKINGDSFLFDNIGVQVTSNATYNKGRLKLGEDYRGHVLIIAKPDSMNLSINGGTQIKVNNYYYEIKRPSNSIGKKEIKGTVVFPIGHNRSLSLDFKDSYEVK